ncbi:MAG TPA: hypothetical protein VFA60_09035 [Terriglobales bacterium]|nr:hypothetical protein [Terriglobales bacterium]
MRANQRKTQAKLNLKVGEWVQVRPVEEILATLDATGRYEGLPFMPEMLQYCGKQFRVYRRADKTCDYLKDWSIRRMTNSVYLEGNRCDGSAHDGCEAACLIWWKEAWLTRVQNEVAPGQALAAAAPKPSPAPQNGLCTVESIIAASRVRAEDGTELYSCQATDVTKFTSYMKIWDVRQYVRDARSGNWHTGLGGNARGDRLLELALSCLHVFRAVLISFFNEIQQRRHHSAYMRYPLIQGSAEKTPLERLNLQPGELVQVKSKQEIIATLDHDQRNRGLWFDSEMLPYCGRIFRVLRRVTRIIDDKTGKLLIIKNPCIVLEGVVCQGEFHRLCPRAIYAYWRENWLRRVSSEAIPEGRELECAKGAEACR